MQLAGYACHSVGCDSTSSSTVEELPVRFWCRCVSRIIALEAAAGGPAWRRHLSRRFPDSNRRFLEGLTQIARHPELKSDVRAERGEGRRNEGGSQNAILYDVATNFGVRAHSTTCPQPTVKVEPASARLYHPPTKTPKPPIPDGIFTGSVSPLTKHHKSNGSSKSAASTWK